MSAWDMLASSASRRRRNLAATSAFIPCLILRSPAIVSSPTVVPSRSSDGEYCWACPACRAIGQYSWPWPAIGEEDWCIGEVDGCRTMLPSRDSPTGEVSTLLMGLVPMEKDLTRGGGGAATVGPLLATVGPETLAAPSPKETDVALGLLAALVTLAGLTTRMGDSMDLRTIGTENRR